MQQQFITKESLLNIGINLEGQDVDSLLAHLNETLEERVGSEITDSLDETQLQNLVRLQEVGTDEQIGEWLVQNVPEYQQIVQDEIDIILGELVENTDGINNVA